MAEFSAQLDHLSEVLQFVERRSEELGASHDVALRAALVAEELFVNCVRHGSAPADSLVRVEMSCDAGELELLFEDGGLAFDPFSHLGQATHLKPLRERPVGGLGVVLVDGLSLRHDYARLEARNCVRVWLALHAD